MRARSHPLHLTVHGSPGKPGGVLSCAVGTFPVRLGRNGVLDGAAHPAEGDGATPRGTFALRQVFYRADRRPRPRTGLPVIAARPDMLWCDDPCHVLYNRPVTAPFAASAEDIWMDRRSYDICIVMDFNLQCPTPGMGSAIFFHLTRQDEMPPPTEGCVAVSPADMDALLPHLSIGSTLTVGLR